MYIHISGYFNEEEHVEMINEMKYFFFLVDKEKEKTILFKHFCLYIYYFE